MHRRIARLSGTFGVAVALAASALTTPTLAALPAGASASATATPATVSAGNYAGFVLSFTNSGPSNISNLFLVADTPSGWQFVNTVNGPALNGTSYGSCPNTGGSLRCSFGAVPAGTGPILVTAVYLAPAGLDRDVTITFHYNSTGSTGGKSHGNDIAAPAGTVHITTDKDLGGQFAYNGNNTVADNSSLSKNNKQSTAVDASGVGRTNFELVVQDGPTLGPPTDGTITGDDCPGQATQTGEWSDLDVGKDTTFTNPFRATIVVYQGGNNTVTGLCWISQTGTDVSGDPIYTGTLLTVASNTCDDPNSPTNFPCFTLTKVGANLQVVFISKHNGRLHLSP
jgi:hypothetical protein